MLVVEVANPLHPEMREEEQPRTLPLKNELIVAIAAEDVVGVVVVEAEEVEAFATTGIVKLDSRIRIRNCKTHGAVRTARRN
jgi:hypothetical protein